VRASPRAAGAALSRYAHRMSISIRAASREDLPLIASMNAQLIEDEGSRNPMGLMELETRARGWLEDGSWRVEIAERDGGAIGYCVYQHRADEYDPALPAVYIRQFFVHRSERSRGVGKKIFAMLAIGFPPRCRVVLEALASNPRGERFWTHVGFKLYAKIMVREEPEDR
jgi:GNAT superfamily N-acetyltransferase